MKAMNRPLPEANLKRATAWGKAGVTEPAGRHLPTCETMNKKRIEGRRGGASWHHTAKPQGSTCPGGKSDVCAGKQRVLTWGDPLVGNDEGKSAEVIVVRAQAGGVQSPV